MFRPMRRFKQLMTEEECVKLLKEEKRGTLAVVGDEGYPYTVPLDFYYDETANRIYFHSAREGHKIDAIRKCGKVCFNAASQGWLDKDEWSYHPSSVVAFGRARIVEDEEEKIASARNFGNKYFPTREMTEEEIAHSAGRMHMVAIEIEHMTGKRVHEK